MSHLPDLRVEPTAPAGSTTRVHDTDHLAGAGAGPARHDGQNPARRGQEAQEAVASTAGQLRAAYAQYVIDPDTHDVVVRIRDANTDQVIHQIPSAEAEALTKSLRTYAEALARRHAAAQGKACCTTDL